MKLMAKGMPLWVPLDERKLSLLANLHARKSPVNKRKA